MKNIISRTLSSLLKAESILIALEAYTSRPNPDNEVIAHLAFSIDDHLGVAKDITIKLINGNNDISTSPRFESIISKSSQTPNPPIGENIVPTTSEIKETQAHRAIRLPKTNAFASRLRLALAHSGMTQGVLADWTGVSQGAISSYVTGRVKEAGITRARLMAQALKVSAMWLIYGEGEMLPAKFLTHSDEV